MERAHQHLVWSYQLLARGTRCWRRPRITSAASTATKPGATSARPGRGGRAGPGAADVRAGGTTLSAQRTAGGGPGRAGRMAIQGRRRGGAALAPARARVAAARARACASHPGGALVQGGRARAAVAAFESAAAAAREARHPEAEAIALSAEALVRFLYLRDPDGARRIARDAAARAFPRPCSRSCIRCSARSTNTGESCARWETLLPTRRSRPFASAPAATSPARARGLGELAARSPYRDFLQYLIADSWMQAKEDGKPSRRCFSRARRSPA